MLTRWCTFLVWAAVAASAVFWGLRLGVQGAPAPGHAGLATAQSVARGDLSRLLGAEAAAPEVAPVAVAVADPRFQLLGVLSAPRTRAEQEGVALIAVDDRPPRAYRVGMVVDGDTVLQAVHARGASLGPRDGLVRVALELPPPAPAATGNLPGAASGGGFQPGLASGRVPGVGAPAGTQVFQPPGQPAPRFTSQRSADPVRPPTVTNALPVPPPAQEVPIYSADSVDSAAGVDSVDDASDPAQADEAGNPLR